MRRAFSQTASRAASLRGIFFGKRAEKTQELIKQKRPVDGQKSAQDQESEIKRVLVGGVPGRGKLNPDVWFLQRWQGRELKDMESISDAIRQAASENGLSHDAKESIIDDDVKFSFAKACMQRTGRRIPDPVIFNATRIADIEEFYSASLRTRDRLTLDENDFIGTNVNIRIK